MKRADQLIFRRWPVNEVHTSFNALTSEFISKADGITVDYITQADDEASADESRCWWYEEENLLNLDKRSQVNNLLCGAADYPGESTLGLDDINKDQPNHISSSGDNRRTESPEDFQACADSRKHERSRVFETEYSVTAVETEALSVSAAWWW